jgi:predicted RNase H-like HicB family nuclease
MKGQFIGIFEKEDQYYVGYCPEIPGANGLGESLDECRRSLQEAIKLILQDRLDDALKGLPPDAIKETLMVI